MPAKGQPHEQSFLQLTATVVHEVLCAMILSGDFGARLRAHSHLVAVTGRSQC